MFDSPGHQIFWLNIAWRLFAWHCFAVEPERVYFARIVGAFFFGCKVLALFFLFFSAGSADVSATKGVFMRLHTAPVRAFASCMLTLLLFF